MSIIPEFLSNLFLITSFNSFMVLLDNFIESSKIEEEEVKDLGTEEKMILSSIAFSLLFFVLDTMIIIFIKKEKILIEISLILFLIIFLYIFKQRRLKIFFKINHLFFDLIIFFRPLLWYSVFKFIFY